MALTFTVPSTELSATLANRRGGIIDNIFEKAVFLSMMKMHGGVKMETGGDTLNTPLRMSKNSSSGSFVDYDLLDVTPQDVITTAQYNWAGLYATISISWMEEQKNSGRHQVFSLLQSKIDDARDTIRDKLNVQLLASQPGAGSKDLQSISELIDIDPTDNPPRGSVGGITTATSANTWWRNKYDTGSSFTVSAMNTKFNDVSQAAERPHFVLTDQTTYQYYENSQTGQIRYASTNVADAGFVSLQFKGIPVVYDPQIGVTGAMYFINTDFLKLTIHTGGDFVMKDFVEPDNQAARTAKILFMGQLEVSNRRREGVISAITAPA